MINWFDALFKKKKPTHAQLAQAQKNILAEISTNIHIIRRLKPTRERTNAIEKLRQLRTAIRNQNVEIKSTQRLQTERSFEDPVHNAAMQTSWKMNKDNALRVKGVAALAARAIIQKQVHMHVLRRRKNKQKATRRA